MQGRKVHSQGTTSHRSNDYYSPTVSSIMKKRNNMEAQIRPPRLSAGNSSPRWMFWLINSEKRTHSLYHTLLFLSLYWDFIAKKLRKLEKTRAKAAYWFSIAGATGSCSSTGTSMTFCGLYVGEKISEASSTVPTFSPVKDWLVTAAYQQNRWMQHRIQVWQKVKPKQMFDTVFSEINNTLEKWLAFSEG